MKTFRNWFPPVLWMGLIFLVSSVPNLSVSENFWVQFVVPKVAHLFEYTVLVVLLARAFRSGSRQDFSLIRLLVPEQVRSEPHLVYSFVFACLYAISDEFHQTFVPGRTGSLGDVLVDGLGAAFGLVVYWWLVLRRKKIAPGR